MCLQKQSMEKGVSLAELEKKMNDYLTSRDLKPTRGRSMILRTLYAYEKSFDAETLYQKMKEERYAVSRSTIYTTLDLLCCCGILVRLAKSSGAIYLHAWRCLDKVLLFCAECGRVNYYKQEDVCQTVQRFTPRRYKKIVNIVMTIGSCTECSKRQKAAERKRLTRIKKQ